MSETVNIPTEEEKTIPENENNDYRGPLGPYEDEIHIRRFAEKHRNAPLYNGAFKQCRINGLTSEIDTRRYNEWVVKSFNSLIFFTILSYYTNFFIADMGYVQITKSIKNNAMRIFIPSILVSGTISSYKFYRMKKELDRKYTAVYLKSRGRL